MSHTPHELAEMFPEYVSKMQELKVSDPRFKRLAEEYHEVNREVHRVETNVEPASDAAMEDMKKQRLGLLDEISTILHAA